MQSQILQCSWPPLFSRNSSFNVFGDNELVMDGYIDCQNFSPPFTTTGESSDCSEFLRFPAIFPDEFMDLPILVEEPDITLPGNVFFMPLEDFDMENMWKSLEQINNEAASEQFSGYEEDVWSLSSLMKSIDISMDNTEIHTMLTLPNEDMELDDQVGDVHLIKAYGEAMDNEQEGLAEVIEKRIREKVSPVGGVTERLLYYLFQQPLDKRADHLKQESGKNFLAAFKAIYQILPYGKLAHSAANWAILKAMPHGAEIIHIIDFDTAEGIQWPSLFEAIGFRQREIKLTSIKWIQRDADCDHSQWRFQETKRWLCDHARYFGLKLTVDSMELHEVVNEIKNPKNQGGRREWFAFNCMTGLPHMGRMRSRHSISEFLRVAKELLACNNTGVVIFGDGDAEVNPEISPSFSSFLDGHLVHSKALLESIEWAFPVHLREARTALECLFAAPLIASLGSKWKEMDYSYLQVGFGLKGCHLSKESIMEAKEMVREGESPYTVSIESESKSTMVLAWSGTPLLKVSCWRS
ncbi:protein NODULATION SIGNALING PATHWAY 2-like [Diospyros lotus]|uniref:protein NODULATION SIGNALING PATHWAY 2-like n=1 Tax=Diospyros lotus TaxID=55363 RepID=UPI0022549256|nr:protein NODULATION SIGNALING PATHWAY 2-like [Diospyros lotus]